MTQKWVSVSEACVLLSISKSTLYRRINEGEIESKREGKQTMCLIDVSDASQHETNDTLNNSLQVIEQLSSENEHLRQQVIQLQENLNGKEADLRRKDEQIAEASHRHDTVVMQMTRIVEYQQQPFWRKLFQRKQLPPPVDETIMDAETGGQEAEESNLR